MMRTPVSNAIISAPAAMRKTITISCDPCHLHPDTDSNQQQPAPAIVYRALPLLCCRRLSNPRKGSGALRSYIVKTRRGGRWLRPPSPRSFDDESSGDDDIGARFGEPSSLIELTRTTGVPRYKIAGPTLKCVAEMVAS
jgi:hypothetical protein